MNQYETACETWLCITFDKKEECKEYKECTDAFLRRIKIISETEKRRRGFSKKYDEI